MKKFIAIGAIALTMTTCSVPATGDSGASAVALQPSSTGIFEWLTQQQVNQTMLEQQAEEAAKQKAAELAKQQELLNNTVKLNNVVEELTERVGKTRYVFSGSTPRGWDCSGMVKWVYGEMGVDLEHRASKQQSAGELVDVPKLGDIVVFKYNGRESSYHVGIYLYPDTMIHAGGGKGDSTEIVSISKFAGKHSTIEFRRIIETS